MLTNKIIRLCLTACLCFVYYSTALAQSASDYLILQDIGLYKLDKPQKVVGGYIGGPRVFDGGTFGWTGHFYEDHIDKTYEIYYEGGKLHASPTVQVTQHTKPDSDRWLLHELDRAYRNHLGLPGLSYWTRNIDGNSILVYRAGGGDYRWLSGNKVIVITYNDAQLVESEPIDVIKAYLAKYPSSLPKTTLQEIRSNQAISTWITDEMERLLWLSEKWMDQLTSGKKESRESLHVIAACLNSFLDYREKYFSKKAKGEKVLIANFEHMNDATTTKAKIEEYHTWLQKHKSEPIDIPKLN